MKIVEDLAEELMPLIFSPHKTQVVKKIITDKLTPVLEKLEAAIEWIEFDDEGTICEQEIKEAIKLLKGE